jgi:hypothetical protein
MEIKKMAQYTTALGICCLAGASVANAGTGSLKPPTLDPTYGFSVPEDTKYEHITSAYWIWGRSEHDKLNAYLRRDLQLSAKPNDATIYVTALDGFALWINGRKLLDIPIPPKGRAPEWPNVRRLNVAEYLQVGRNVIAVKVLNSTGQGGLIARLELPGQTPIETDTRWVSYLPDIGAPPEDWVNASYNDAGWWMVSRKGMVNSAPWECHVGLIGWPGYEEPFLKHVTLPFERVVEVRPEAGRISGTEDARGEFAVESPIGGKSPLPSFVLDFGSEIAGRARIIPLTSGTVQLGLGESLNEALKAPWTGTHDFELTPDKPAHSIYSAFRYVHVSIKPSETPVRFRVEMDHKYYPVTYKGSFNCSDPELTRMWYMGAYTSHLCMQEQIWDAPKRDREAWIGDLAISGEVINNVFADQFLMEHTLKLLRDEAQVTNPPGALPHHHVNWIAGYSAAWIDALADYHRHIGNYEFLRSEHDSLTSLLDYMIGDLDERNLFANKRAGHHGFTEFVDWSPLFEKFDPNGDMLHNDAVIHMQYVKAMREAAYLLREMGDESRAAMCEALADTMSESARKHLLDPSTGLCKGWRHDNAFAVYAGVPEPEQIPSIYNQSLSLQSTPLDALATPYFNNFVIYAMSLAGHNTDALEFIRRIWGGMLADGATSWWEAYDPGWPKDDSHAHLQADMSSGYFVSLCHGWSSGPTNWLTERLLGVRPTGAGFKTVIVAPDLGDLEWAEGTVPTPHGAIHVRAEKSGQSFMRVFLTLPSGVDATVSLPGDRVKRNARRVSGAVAENGRITIHVKKAGEYELLSSGE